MDSIIISPSSQPKPEPQPDILASLNLVIVGHVDHGKSTIIGRLLADSGSLPQGKLEQVKETCRRNAKPFEYAFLLDALKDEQSQGITIDAARCFFKTTKRKYIIIDAPGHIEFLKNMVTGAAYAEAALLVIDAAEGIRENSRRHGYLLSMLGIRQVAVLINKMDLVNYSQSVFAKIAAEYTAFLKKVDIRPHTFVPVSGTYGDNITTASANTPWYPGATLLQVLDEFEATPPPEGKPFRLPVQGVYKFTAGGDQRRIIAGTVTSGSLSAGAEVVFYPSGKKSTVVSFEAFNGPSRQTVTTGCAAGFTLAEQLYITRGELAAAAGEAPPKVSPLLRVNLFWLGKKPLVKEEKYLLKLGTAKVPVRLEAIRRVLHSADLREFERDWVEHGEAAECTLRTEQAIAFDLAAENPETGRFVLVDEYEIAGGGIILEALEDSQSELRDFVLRRNYKWEKSFISREARVERYQQQPVLILITGPRNAGKKALAKALEEHLFTAGKIVYFMGIANLLYGVDADIKNREKNHREEHLRRLGEVAHLMLDAGNILIVTAVELTPDDLSILTTVSESKQIITVWIGPTDTTSLPSDIQIPILDSVPAAVEKISELLAERSIPGNDER